MEQQVLNMVLMLSFINGIFCAATIYYVITAYKTKVSYESMLEHQSSLQARQSYENQLLREKAEDMEVLIVDIQSNMEKDNYSDLSNINKKIQTIETTVNNHSLSWKEEEKFKGKVMESLANIKQWMKRMGDDPTLIRGY